MTLKEVFSTVYLKGAIFTRLKELFNVSFLEDVNEAKEVDIDFFTQYGRRQVSNLIDDLLNDPSIYDNLDYVIDDNGEYVVTFSNNVRVTYSSLEKSMVDILCDIIYNRFHYQWDMLYRTLKVSYNPIYNYQMTETEHTGSDITTTDDYKNNSSSVNNQKVSTNEKQSNNQSLVSKDETKNLNYGFNSSESTPTNDSITNIDSTTNTTNSLTNEQAGESSNDINATNSGTRNVQGDFDKNKRELTREGNIGVTTSAQMLEQEHQVWKYDFYKQIFKQLSELITLPIYL